MSFINYNSGLSAATVLDRLKQIGLNGKLSKTGHVDYERVFVLDPAGVSIGRMTIFRGEYSHTKWYVKKANFTGCLRDNEIYVLMWEWFERLGRQLSTEEIFKAWDMAEAESDQIHRDRLQWRALNLSPKTRKNIYPPNPRKYLIKYLTEVTGLGAQEDAEQLFQLLRNAC